MLIICLTSEYMMHNFKSLM